MIIRKLSASQCQDVQKLSEDRNYVVYAVLFSENIKFLVEDEDVFSFPFYIPSNEVEIINNTVSKDWKYQSPLDRNDKYSSRPAMLACEELLDRMFYQKLVEGNKSAKETWKLIKRQQDSEII